MLPNRFRVLLFLLLWNCLICPTKCNDYVAPVLVCPVNIDKTTTTTHATVTWMDPDVTDNVDSGLTSTCSPSSGSSFAVGSTQVTCTASDVAGNTGSCFFDVNVIVDYVAPVLVCPVNIDKTTTTTYATVTWMDPDVTDNVDSGLTSTCSPSSGSSFAVGSTPVTCTASDVAGNTGSCFFDVNVIVSESTTEFSSTATSTIEASNDTTSPTNSTSLDWYIIAPSVVVCIIFLVMFVAFIKLYRSYVSVKKKQTENTVNDGNNQFIQEYETYIDISQYGTTTTSSSGYIVPYSHESAVYTNVI